MFDLLLVLVLVDVIENPASVLLLTPIGFETCPRYLLPIILHNRVLGHLCALQQICFPFVKVPKSFAVQPNDLMVIALMKLMVLYAHANPSTTRTFFIAYINFYTFHIYFLILIANKGHFYTLTDVVLIFRLEEGIYKKRKVRYR